MTWEHLKHLFIDFMQVAFRAGQEAENEFKVPFGHLKHRFLDLKPVTIWSSRDVENEFAMPGDQLKHRFIDLTQVSFFAIQEAENDFAVPGDHLKHRFPDLTQDSLCVSPKTSGCLIRGCSSFLCLRLIPQARDIYLPLKSRLPPSLTTKRFSKLKDTC